MYSKKIFEATQSWLRVSTTVHNIDVIVFIRKLVFLPNENQSDCGRKKPN